MSLAFGTINSPQHHTPQLSPRMSGGGGISQDWLKAWKAWAATRKRGKMAQFIVQKLEENKQARWLNISAGKFELTEWHNIAEEWFKEKPRSSDQVDAPCMLRKGLPRAFPGLDEVKTESVKEGTQYRSRVFQAPQPLVQEVQLYVNKPSMAGGGGYTSNGSMNPYFNSMGQKEGQGNFIPSGGFVSINQTQNIMSSQTSSHYHGTSPNYGSPHTTSFQHMSPSQMKVNSSMVGSKVMSQGYAHSHTSYGEMSPGGNTDGSTVKVEERSPYSVQNSSPYSIVDPNSPPMSESTYSNYSDGGGLYNGHQNSSPVCIKSEGQVFDGYDQMTDSSPYSVNGAGGLSPATAFSQSHLEVPTADGVLGGPDWGGVGDMGVTGLTPVSSPHYSPEPNNFQAVTSNPLDIDLTSGSMVSPGLIPPHPPPIQQPQPQAFLDVKPYPDKSPLEGGGRLALLFGGELPQGPKWLSFISQQRPEYIHQVQAYEENVMALSTIIPKHDIPETMTLQVIVHGQVVAQTNFTYYASAQYNSDMLFHYLVQNFPGYFPEVGMDGGMGGTTNGGGGDVFSGGGYYGNVPSTSFHLLLGSCRLGIEELVLATLQLPSMKAISSDQLRKAHRLCEEHSHSKLAEVMQGLVEISEITSRGDEDSEDEESVASVVTSEEGQKFLSQLNISDSPETGGMSIISRLVQIHKMDKRSKLEEEREQQVPSSPTILPASPVPENMEKSTSSSHLSEIAASDVGEIEEDIPRQRRRSSSNRLQRQEKSVREDDDLPPPISQHSRQSIAEKDDHLPPLRPVPPSSRRMQKRPLISTHSDAADSAVSMSFDREHGDYEQEVARRSSASIALLGLYSLNMSSMDGSAVTIKIEPEAGYTFANSLQYECIYQVTDDYPSQSDATSVIFKAGDKIIQIGDTLVRDKGPDDFAGLLQEAVSGTTVRIVPRVSPPPSTTSINSSLGYGSLDAPRLKQTDQQVIDSITMKVSNLLSMKGTGFKRTLTLPFVVADKGFGFKMIGGNAVGLFVSEAKRKELQVGDQILEIAGHSALQMSHYEATELITQAKDTLQLKVTQNVAKFKSIRDQFEYESFYIRCHVDHAPSDSKDMTLSKGSLVRVVNSSLYPNSWLAWSVDDNTGIDMELRRIPSPAKAYQQFGKHVYQPVEGPSQDIMIS